MQRGYLYSGSMLFTKGVFTFRNLRGKDASIALQTFLKENAFRLGAYGESKSKITVEGLDLLQKRK